MSWATCKRSFLLSATIVVGGCGVDESNQYDGKKFSADATPRVPSDTSDDSSGAGSSNTPTRSSVSTGGSNDVGGGADDASDIAPETIVLKNQYRAQFDTTQLFRLMDDGTRDMELSVAESTIKDKLGLVTAQDGLIVSQTYGDGVALSNGQQVITNTPGDQEINVDAGMTSASGTQTYVRTTADPDCPSDFICVQKLTFMPMQGAPISLCFKDELGRQVKAIPYAISPTIKRESVAKLAKSYGPFMVQRYRSANIDCNNAGGAPDLVETVRITVEAGSSNLSQVKQFFQNAAAPVADLEVVMRNERLAGDAASPYIDETVKMQKQTRYLIDSKTAKLVKMIKNVRSSVTLPFFAELIMDRAGI